MDLTMKGFVFSFHSFERVSHMFQTICCKCTTLSINTFDNAQLLIACISINNGECIWTHLEPCRIMQHNLIFHQSNKYNYNIITNTKCHSQGQTKMSYVPEPLCDDPMCILQNKKHLWNNFFFSHMLRVFEGVCCECTCTFA